LLKIEQINIKSLKIKQMKKLQIIIVMLLIGTAFTACHRGSRTVIITRIDDSKIKIEYSGAIMLNDDKTGIQGLSHNGYISYNKNGDELDVASGPNGSITYELNGEKTSVLNSHGKTLLAEAIKLIAKQQGKM
jgi:uncharacterized protein YxeA